MEIDINQKKITIGDKYSIYVNGEESYHASTELISLMSKIYLFNNQENSAKVVMNKRWGWLGAKYDIKYGSNTLNFRTQSFWKLHYQCQLGEYLYDIYGHKGRKYSVYENDRQIAWWDKEMITWFEGDNYHIVLDDDCEFELVISFCLILDDYSSSNSDGNTITFDFGNIGGQKKEFNTTWQPNQE